MHNYTYHFSVLSVDTQGMSEWKHGNLTRNEFNAILVFHSVCVWGGGGLFGGLGVYLWVWGCLPVWV